MSIDLYLNETSRHAHLILPPTSPLERSHYDIALSGFAVRNVAKYSPPLFAKPAGSLHDHEILAQIARRLRKAPGSVSGRVSLKVKDALARRLGPDGTLDWMLKTGRYGVPYAGKMKLLGALPGFGALRKLMRATDRRPVGLTLQRLLDAPNGVDLGALETAFPRRIATPNRRIELAPAMFVADLGRAAAALDAARAGAVADRSAPRAQQQFLAAQQPAPGEGQAALHAHAAPGRRSGPRPRRRRDRARHARASGWSRWPWRSRRTFSRAWSACRTAGATAAPVCGSAIASAHAGVSINDLVDDQRIDALTGTAVLNGTPVEVVAA